MVDVADCKPVFHAITGGSVLARSGVRTVAVTGATKGAVATTVTAGAGVDSSASSARRADRLSSIRSTIAPGATSTCATATSLSTGIDGAESGAVATTACGTDAAVPRPTDAPEAGGVVAAGALNKLPPKPSGLTCIHPHPAAPAAASTAINPIQTQRRDCALETPDALPMLVVPWRNGVCDATGVPGTCGACASWRWSRSRSILLITLTTCSRSVRARRSPIKVAGGQRPGRATVASTTAGAAPPPACPWRPGARAPS